MTDLRSDQILIGKRRSMNEACQGVSEQEGFSRLFNRKANSSK